MGLNLGVLGQIATPAFAGLAKGQAIGEAETYKRKQDEEERQRQIREAALREQLLQGNIEKQQFEIAHQGEDREAAQAKDRFQQFKDIPELYAPQTLPGEPSYNKPGDQLVDDERRSRIAENEAQTALARKRERLMGAKAAKGPQFQQALDMIAESTGGNLAETHRKINEDPQLFQLRANHTIRDYHVAAAAAKARKAAGKEQQGIAREQRAAAKAAGAAEGEPDQGGMPASYKKFPSESVEAWVRRMHKMGLDSATVFQYGQSQGIE